MVVKIPRLFKTKTIKINDEEIELKGYRVIDNELVVPILHKRNEVTKYAIALNGLTKKSDEELSEEDLEKAIEMKDQLDSITAEVRVLSNDLAQRGLKRFYYKDEPEYKEAEKDNNLTEYIDSLPDIEIDPDSATLIVNEMIALGSPTEAIKEAGKGKPNKKAQKKS